MRLGRCAVCVRCVWCVGVGVGVGEREKEREGEGGGEGGGEREREAEREGCTQKQLHVSMCVLV